jgi:hypothetical protein
MIGMKFSMKRDMKRAAAPTIKRTTVTFTAKDLDDLARVLAAGHALLRQSFPVVSRLKAAMTKMGIATKGL